MIATERLILRRWRQADAAAHRALVTDPRVVATLGGPPPADRSTEVVERQNRFADETGSCFWAVEHRATGAFIGWCGVKPGPEGTPTAGLPEIGWALAPVWWGQGLAREAAEASLAHGWAIGLDRVYAITTSGNTRSWSLMERLGMARLPDGDFDHPALAEDDPLRRHITYAIDRP